MIVKYSIMKPLFVILLCFDDFGNEVELSDESKNLAWYFLGVERALTDL